MGHARGWLAGVGLVLVASLPVTASGEAPPLTMSAWRVKDIAPGDQGARFASLTDVGGTLLFAAGDTLNGAELWRTDATGTAAFRVKDLWPGPSASFYVPPALAARRSLFHPHGGTTYFAATDGLTGTELWRTDGTPAGTWRVKDISPGILSGLSGVSDFADGPGGFVYFAATDDVRGWELWKTDGTEAGTSLVRELQPMSQSSMPTDGSFLGTVGNALLFMARQESLGTELWRTDGTESGTWLVRDILPGPVDSYQYASTSIARVKGGLLFPANDGATGVELWRTDGTEAGTVRVKDISPFDSSRPTALVSAGDTVYFLADDGTHGYELWRTDGTEAGTWLVRDIFPGAQGGLLPSRSNRELVVLGTTVFFVADNGTDGPELWKSDGTQAGTVRVRDIRPGQRGSNPRSLTVVGDTLFFAAEDDAHGLELWKSDGTVAGTVLVRDLHPGPKGATLSQLTAVGTTLFLVADDGLSGEELWKSDGTWNGTVPVANIERSPRNSSPGGFTEVDGSAFFLADDGLHGRELWRTDGTEAGTVLVRDIAPDDSTSEPGPLTRVGNQVLFASDDGAHGKELWRSDGTEAGTALVRDIRPGAGSGLLHRPWFATVKGTTLFSASDDLTGHELWKSDGTEAGTVRVRDIWPGATDSAPDEAVVVGDTLFFVATDGTAGRELWKSDGTEAGTVRVRDILPGRDHALPTRLVAVGERLFFVANDGVHGHELWTSDGTEEGTHLVRDLWPGPSAGNLLSPVAMGGTLFFTFEDGTHGPELWKSDGTEAGTTLVVDLFPGPTGAFPMSLVSAGGRLFFTAMDESGNREVWTTDGTPAGTVRLSALRPELSGASHLAMSRWGDLLLFVRLPAQGSPELWRSDGTVEGTRPVARLPTGMERILPSNFHPLGDSLLFSGQDALRGIELWRLDADPSPLLLSCPEATVVEALSGHGAPVSWRAATVSGGTGTVQVTYSHETGSTLPVGDTPIYVTAEETGGRGAVCTFTASVRDSRPPWFPHCPQRVQLAAQGPYGGFFSQPFSPAVDDVSPYVALTFQPERGLPLPLGTTQVTVTATDGSGNLALCMFPVTVSDRTPPTPGCRSVDIHVEAEDATGATVNLPSPRPLDDITKEPTVSASHASGSRFPVGTTTVSYTVTDEAGNASTCTTDVKVVDSTRPTVKCPEDIALETVVFAGTAVEYPPVEAWDAVSRPALSYSPAPGSVFAPGKRRVEVTATDASGNSASCSFQVAVDYQPLSGMTAPVMGCACEAGTGTPTGLGWGALLLLAWAVARRGPRRPEHGRPPSSHAR